MKLIVLDCDGVIAGGENQPFTLPLLERLARLNQLAKSGQPYPAVTLNTGRPSPYVEAVMQAICGWMPALYENGAGLFDPRVYGFETSPLFTDEMSETLGLIIKELEQFIVKKRLAYWQPGKSVCLSLIAHKPLTREDIFEDVVSLVSQISGEFVVVPAKRTLNIYPRNINKGTGIQWLTEKTGIGLAEMGGVGDTRGDIDFLQHVGFSAAPGNATDDVRASVHWVSDYPDAEGLGNILDYWQLP